MDKSTKNTRNVKKIPAKRRVGSPKGALKGKKNAMKPADKQIEYMNLYVKHLQDGYDKKNFVPCDYRTVEKYFILHAKSEILETALRANRFFWERIYRSACIGEIEGANMTGLIFAIKNKCGWRDKQDVEHTFREYTIEYPDAES